MSLSCTVNDILSLISQNLKRSRESEHIAFGEYVLYAIVLMCINPHTKFKVRRFTNSKYVIGRKVKKGSRNSDHAN